MMKKYIYTFYSGDSAPVEHARMWRKTSRIDTISKKSE